MREIKVGKSHTVTLNPYQEANFRFTINKTMDYKTLYFKFVSLVGDCSIYVSPTNKYPDRNNNMEKLEIKNKNLTSISTKTFS